MTTEEFFDEATKEQFMEDDRQAWNAICTILFGIIVTGLAIALLAIWLVTTF